MALLTVENIDRDGLIDVTLVAADADGDTFPNEGKRTIFYVVNGSGSSLTLTLNFADTLLVDGETPPDPTVVVGIGENAFIGPFPVGWYGGVVEIDYSIVTTVTVVPLMLTTG